MMPVLLAAALAAACDAGTGPGPSPVPTRVRIAADSVQLYVGEGAVIPAAALDEDGEPVPGARLSWSTSDPAVVAVDSAGRVLALRPGRAEVGVHLPGASAQAASIGVRVAPRPDRLEIGRDTVTIVAPGTATACEVTVSPALFDRTGARVFGQAVSYAVEDTTVAGVRRGSGGTAGIVNGYVFGRRAGETRLIASSAGYQDTALVRVLPGSPSAVRVFRAPEWPEGSLTPGDTLRVRGEVVNQCGRPVPELPVTFSSGAPAVVEVSPSGRVLGLAAGTAYVIGSWQQARRDSVPVNVAEYRILPADTTVFVGDTFTLRGTMNFGGGAAPVYPGLFRYAGSDSTVVRLLERGEPQRAVAVGEGEALVTAERAGRARARVRVLRRP
jgi:hypothetical protein